MGKDYKRFQEADYLRKMGEQGVGLAKSVARGVPQMATGLVDLAAMPFEAAGVLQPGQAVGSTKWLESKGYLPEQQEGFANQLTELLSGGFDLSDLVTKGLPALGMIGKTTWHGSPHGFTKFDMSKIGTGEGAQAYGHGLYLAEARPVAEEYATNLSKDVFNVGGELFNPADIKHLNVRTLARKGDIGSAIKKATELAASDSPVADLAKLDLDLLQQAKAKGGFQEAPGYLYKVDLPDEQIAKMLDYDLPLANQPEQVKQSLLQLNDPHINEALSTSPVYNEAGDYWSYMGNTYGSKSEALRDVTPAQLISGQRGSFASPQEASQRFYEAGIPGIRYLDQASRGAGEGTSNYVVFSDEIPQILERNGQPIAQALRNYEAPQAQALREAEEYGQKMLGLPPGNTPMDRAIAGGFEPTYHGSKTPELINETGYLIPGGRAGSVRSGDAYGVGAYTTTSPFEASAPVYTGEEGAVYPLMIQRQNFLNPSNLSDIDKAKLNKFAEENLLPSDKARFEAGIKQKTFLPEETGVAKEFFENQQKNAEQFGAGYDRTKPWIDKDESGNFVINYTDFDAPITINTKQDAEKLLSAVGYDAVPSIGYAGHTLEKAGGKKWDVTNDTGALRSQFAAFDPRYFGKPGLLLGAGGLGVYGTLQSEDEYQ